MLRYGLHRFFYMLVTLFVVSILVFIIIQLPPGDYFETYLAELRSEGGQASLEKIAFLRAQYGLDEPMVIRYIKWVSGLLQGDLGFSFEHNRPVSEVIGDRLLLTILLNFFTIIFIWVVSFPIGIYSARHQYSVGDYSLTFIGLLGLATPNFLLSLIFMYFSHQFFGISIGGLMDPHYIDQPMSWDKARSILSHIWIPVIIIGTSGTAGMIRRLRANLLDELQKPYVLTAKAKGLSAKKALRRYPLRVALNPFIADIGNILPQIVSGSAIVSVVLSLPTAGPLLLNALQSQDMYLAGAFLMFLSVLTIIGTLISDILLGLLDPRIRYGIIKTNDA